MYSKILSERRKGGKKSYFYDCKKGGQLEWLVSLLITCHCSINSGA